ncbi:uncharacterized protein LOC115100214 [Rhinatrema bivittatum]|uniref:uncharacterized protein LOC115100214 n=1 Tax=Rhinatrema bivittatum TaxID=194408 RepID=UPI00112A7D70|nr:uncharacterized protein LOC115100214 [Rhinatrema bivittatum]
MTGPGGEQHLCNTTATRCSVSGLQCGQTYAVTVTALSANCSSAASATAVLETAPCKPNNTEILLDCGSNTATLSWDGAAGAVHYTSTVTGPDGQQLSCNTTDTTCDVADLQCGQTYLMAVTAFSATCSSATSDTTAFQTVPCVPKNVETQLDCGTNITAVSWDGAAGAVSYTSTVTGADGEQRSCNATSTTCDIGDLQCGQTYAVSVTALNDQCSSAASATTELQTAPCVPNNVTALLDCGTNTASLSWGGAAGAVSYTSTVIGPDGDQRSCNATDTSCNVTDLQCGQTYTVSVIALGYQCSSAVSPAAEFETAPCAPTQLTVNLDCSTNAAMPTWDSAPGAVDYISMASGPDGHQYSCNSTDTTCRIDELPCGQMYAVTVTARSAACSSAASSMTDIQTAPCVPTNLESVIDCGTNAAIMSWNNAQGAKGYSSTVTGPDGQQQSCNATDTTCEVSDLQCGQAYTVTVTALDDQCGSAASASIQMQSVPCIPNNLKAQIVAETNIGTLSWERASGATSYTSSVTGPDGEQHSCNATDTTCNITALQCGLAYTASVIALSDQCSSVASATTELQTVPCIPQNVSSSLNPVSNTLSVSWDPALGAESYTTIATDSDGHAVSCNSTGTACEISGLECGKVYSVVVVAENGSLESSPSAPILKETAPCPPKNVVPYLDYSTNTLTVSWGLSSTAISYVTMVWGDNGFQQWCNTTSSSCDIPDLACGKTFNISVVAVGREYESLPSSLITVETGPCVPSNINVTFQCGNNSVFFSWKESLGADSYALVATDAGGHTESCDTIQVYCSVSNLLCGSYYNVTLQAYSQGSTGLDMTEMTLKSAPCPPYNLRANLNCTTNTAIAQWEHDGEAISYRVTANGTNGHLATCNSSSVQTSCDLEDLECGQTYVLLVQAVGVHCSSAPSEEFLLNSAPCPPDNVQGIVDCASNIVIAFWDKSKGAESYRATAESSDGYSATCITNDTSCELHGLLCGSNYHILVIALKGNCNSSDSSSFQIETAPCMPQNLIAQDSCDGTVTVLWASSAGAESYALTARQSDGSLILSNTTDSFSELSSLPCGETYSTTVQALSSSCASPLSQELVFDTVPCVPQNVSAYMACNSEVASLLWEPSPGAQLYHAVLMQSDGNTSTCSTANTTCSVSSLVCGQAYSISVTATNENCTSIASSFYEIQTAPCPPQQVSAQLDCSSNTAVVSWELSNGTQLYTVRAETTDGQVSWCNSTKTNCNLVDLSCGQNYTITVQGSNHECDSLPSLEYQLQTVPCSPTKVETSLDCITRAMSVSWEPALGVVQYIVTATAEQYPASCVTENTTCELQDLVCGQEYIIMVMGTTGQCNSSMNSLISVTTTPCAPRLVDAYTNCENNSATVSWESTANAEYYTALVEGAGGASCNTTNTTCDIADLSCGQTYTVAVLAHDSRCEGPLSPEMQIKTAPCVPLSVMALMMCAHNEVLVSWDPSPGAISYEAAAIGKDGQPLTCKTGSTNCLVSGLQCGEFYSLTVIAVHEECKSFESLPIYIKSVPCTPENLQVEVYCENDTVIASWSPSDGAVSYTATALGKDNHSMTCSSSDTHCTITSMDCGSNYTISVKALDDTCNSSDSNSEGFHTAPCAPQIVQADCAVDTAVVSWQYCKGATSYTVTVEGSNGHIDTCLATGTSCEIPDLHCGRTYEVYVTAHNEICNSTANTTREITTDPCGVQNITVNLDCETSAAEVFWEPSEGSLSYAAVAEGSDGQKYSCFTPNTACLTPALHCGDKFTFTVIAVGAKSNTTSVVSYTAESAPCPVENFTAQVVCDSNLVSVSWGESSGAASYTVQAFASDGSRGSCNTTATLCELPDLHCGLQYNFTLLALSSTCQSLASQPFPLRTAPCKPESVTASLHCASNVVSVSWVPSAGDASFLAFAVGRDGQLASCNTTETSCDIIGLTCGQMYNVSVIAADDYCSSLESDNAEIKTVPCLPLNASAEVDCATNVIMVSWGQSEGSESYTAIATTVDGQTHSCNTTDTGCDIRETQCGETYMVTVVAKDSQCNVSAVSVGTYDTAPCAPEHVASEFACSPDAALVSWQEAGGAVNYTAVAENPLGSEWTCEAQQTSCQIRNLECGQRYLFKVQATNAGCNSSFSSFYAAVSAPCPPTNVSINHDCGVDDVAVSWSPSDGALSYLAVAVGNGRTFSCNSTGSGCTLPALPCGVHYNLTVVAEDDQCSSVSAAASEFYTAPCIPQVVDIEQDCENNAALVFWAHSEGAIFYEVTAESGAGQVISYITGNMSIAFPDLLCGETYTVTVKALNDGCNSSRSSGINMQTAPCSPENVRTLTYCESSVVSLSWNQSSGAELYAVTAIGGNGTVAFYGTEDLSYNLTDLKCGQAYNISIFAQARQCNSSLSPAVEIRTVPCIPQSVEAYFDCGRGVVDVSWESTSSELVYTATAQGNIGYPKSCTTSNATCEISDLLCGHTYTVTVTAEDFICTSTESTTAVVKTASCALQNVVTQVDCLTNSGNVSWDASDGADFYVVTTEGSEGYVMSCNTTDTTCMLQELQCGLVYNVTMFAADGVCDETYSVSTLRTGACPPQNVAADFECATGSVAVFWDKSDGAVSYTAITRAASGDALSCNTTDTFCNISTLLCGHTYSVTVTVLDKECHSQESGSLDIKTVPCAPSNVTASTGCSESTMMVFWDHADNAESYQVAAVGSDGKTHTCYSNTTECNLMDLSCGQAYAVTVSAFHNSCSSEPSPTVFIETAPCPPEGVVRFLDCDKNIVTVSWEPSNRTVLNVVTAVGNDGHETSCNSSDTVCSLADLHCGVRYNVSIGASWEACTSSRNTVFEVDTVPCTPQDVVVSESCITTTAQISWNHSAGAQQYSVVMNGSGISYSCNSSDTFCDVIDLQCGLPYSVIVVAFNEECQSPPSFPIETQTAPCAPEEVGFRLNCETNVASVSWAQSTGAEEYHVTATTAGREDSSCNTTDTTCLLVGLKCGVTYTVDVFALDNGCASTLNSSIDIVTVPCIPENSNVQMECLNNSALFTWEHSRGALSYMATVSGSDNFIYSYYTEDTFCSISTLTCGTMYLFSVAASNGICNSTAASLTSGFVPCSPDQVEASNYHSTVTSQEVEVTWSESQCGNDYMATVQGQIENDPLSQFVLNSSWTTCLDFYIPTPCSSSYNITVIARNSAGLSSPSPPISGFTAPCAPKVKSPAMTGTTMQISWEPSVLATEYRVNDATTKAEICRTSTLACDFDFTAHPLEVIAVNSAGESEPSPV